MANDKAKQEEEDQVAEYLEQIRSSRETLNPCDKSPDHHHTEAKLRQNKTAQMTATKKIAASRKPVNPRIFKKRRRKK